MAELSYVEAGGTKHINAIQEWEVKDANNTKVFLQLGGFRRNGQRNTFAMKHLMAKPKKIAETQEQKAERRLVHRIDHYGATHGRNPHPGLKPAAAHAQTRSDKYGTAMSIKNLDVQNTVIDLQLCNINTVLYHIATRCVAEKAGWPIGNESTKNIVISFPQACVRTVLLNLGEYGPTAPGAPPPNPWTFNHQPLVTTVHVTACRIDENSFEVYHLG